MARAGEGGGAGSAATLAVTSAWETSSVDASDQVDGRADLVDQKAIHPLPARSARADTCITLLKRIRAWVDVYGRASGMSTPTTLQTSRRSSRQGCGQVVARVQVSDHTRKALLRQRRTLRLPLQDAACRPPSLGGLYVEHCCTGLLLLPVRTLVFP